VANEAVEYLTRIAQEGSATYTRYLAASERAVVSGQFNLSKVLRTVGYSLRVQALNAYRLLDETAEPSALLDYGVSMEMSAHGNEAVVKGPDEQVEDFRQRNQIVSEAVSRLSETGRMSYRTHGEVFDDDVDTGYIVCSGCGMIFSGDAPKGCSICGALEVDFEWFGPFYLITHERLCRRTPGQIVSILEDTPARITEVVAGREDDILARRPSEKEWSVKEIVGHIRDVEELFLLRISPILESDEQVSLPVGGLPWTLHEGKGYETLPMDELLARFGKEREKMLSLLSGLAGVDWVRTGLISGVSISLLDFGTWVAVHNIGHIAQIRRRLEVAVG